MRSIVLGSITLLTSILPAQKLLSQSADLDQIRNGSATAPITPGSWVNGNAGPSNAHFAEGYSIPYRMRVASLVGNANTIHTLVIEWDTKDQNGHAIDYITHYSNLDYQAGSHQATFNHNPEVIDPTIGTAFNGAPVLFPIKPPSAQAGAEVAGMPLSSFNTLKAAEPDDRLTMMAIWGGTITEMNYLFENVPNATTASTKTQLEIKFKAANGTSALLAWGGHIAAEYDWGVGRGASGVSGSPYHTRLISIDGKGGNQDRSLKASAVVIPPPLCPELDAQYGCPETASFVYTVAAQTGVGYSWSLTNGTPSAGAQISGSTTGTSVTVVPTGTDFIAGGTFSLTLTMTKTGTPSVQCQFPAIGTIVKVVATASATPTNIDILQANASSQLDVSLTGSDDTDPTKYTYSWTSDPDVGASLSATNIKNPVFTPTGAQAGECYEFTVVVTQIADPNCSATSTVEVCVSAGPTCPSITGPTPVCANSTGHEYNVGEITGATYAWIVKSGDANITDGAATRDVTVDAGDDNFQLEVTITFANALLTPIKCTYDVVVNANPTVEVQYIAPDCEERYFKVKVTNPAANTTYSIDQPQNDVDYSSQDQTWDGVNDVIFEGLIIGDGYTVSAVSNNCNSAPNTCDGAPAEGLSSRAPTETMRSVEDYTIKLEAGAKVQASPNPYTDRIRFRLESNISGRGVLELYNMLGQKVQTVFDGHIEAGQVQTREYSVPSTQRNSMIYIFRVGDQRTTGKLIGLK